ncbi:MAG: hypothetical protein JNM94_02715 [Phycisphaerae bacterium]|nr:hypothetical protein [Phycisphaerae bacterium]
MALGIGSGIGIGRIGWAIWALVPVGVVAYHFGPGQQAAVLDSAASLQRDAMTAEASAKSAQDAAYQAHLAAIDARRAAFVAQSPAADEAAKNATNVEQAAYAKAAESWASAADAFTRMETLLTEAETKAAASGSPALGTSDLNDELLEVRLAKSRALVRSGDVWGGITELESVLEAVEENPDLDSTELRTREELGTAYYFGARLLRLSGKPADEWRIESGQARQQFRYLAERARAEGGAADAADLHQKNLELVLNLEQLDLNELKAKPLPKNSPCQGKEGNRPCNGNKKSKRPPQKKDARGAGGASEIPWGW